MEKNELIQVKIEIELFLPPNKSIIINCKNIVQFYYKKESKKPRNTLMKLSTRLLVFLTL